MTDLLPTILAAALVLALWRNHRLRERVADLSPQPPTPRPVPRPLAVAIATVVEARTIRAGYGTGSAIIDTTELDRLADANDVPQDEIDVASEQASMALLRRYIERTAADRNQQPADVADELVLYAESDLMPYVGLDAT